MKLKPLALAVTLLLPGMVTATTVEFAQSVEATLSQNPQRDVSSSRIDQAQAAVEQARLGRMPQFNLSLTASQSSNPLNAFGMKLQQQRIDGTEFAPETINSLGPETDFNTRIEMQLPVWNGGRIAAFQQQAGAMLQAAQQGDVAVQQMLTYYVYEAYEGVHAARAFIQVAEQALRAAQAYVNTTRNMVNQGVVVRSELLSAQAHESEMQLMLEQAKNQELMALDGLRMLMGLEPESPLDVGERVNMRLDVHDVEQLATASIERNPQLQALRYQSHASRAAVSSQRADLYPSFNIMARNDWNDDRLGFRSSSYTVAAVASWQVMDFGMTARSVDRANAEAREQEANLRAQEQSVRLDILRAWREYQNALKKVESNQAALEFAKEAQSLISRRYETGVATITEVLVGQAQLDKARAELVNAKYSVNIQKAKLRLATGQMSLDSI